MRILLFLVSVLIIGCEIKTTENQKNKEGQHQKAPEKTSRKLVESSYYLRGDESLILVERFKKYEDLIGVPVSDIPDEFGVPVDTVLEEGSIDERDALVYYFEYPVSEYTNIYLKAATQYGKIVGLQLSSTPNAELVYSSARFLIASRGLSWTPGGLDELQYHAARSGDLVWQIGFKQEQYGKTAVVNVGTLKYSWCDLAWDAEDLWGKDGFGNKVDTTVWKSPVEKNINGK